MMLENFYLATFSHIFVAVTIYNVYQTVLETLDLPHVSNCKTVKFVSNNGFIIFLYRVNDLGIHYGPLKLHSYADFQNSPNKMGRIHVLVGGKKTLPFF